MSVNKVILVGRLGKDPEVRTTNGDQTVANFSIATDESYKNRDGEKVKRTEWHRIVIWGKLAGIVEQYLTKGSLVYLEGRIQTKEWEDGEGVKRTNKDIVCDTLRMLGGGERNDDEPEERPAAKAKNSGKSTTKKTTKREKLEEPFEPSDEDIPF